MRENPNRTVKNPDRTVTEIETERFIIETVNTQFRPEVHRGEKRGLGQRKKGGLKEKKKTKRKALIQLDPDILVAIRGHHSLEEKRGWLVSVAQWLISEEAVFGDERKRFSLTREEKKKEGNVVLGPAMAPVASVVVDDAANRG
ncbi:hypothetical protein LR48_Vigan10g066300 [Vigna angularis]|uniref:Uncharacterized protein n=1 Tax=Phaseolus angularis TaxID=3914 RepID=A0A0L9VI88_PHAAN|nr:hypothetical protein LR48_Vigan10g066300 [Vigna angularis]